jgi:hypothetical protein
MTGVLVVDLRESFEKLLGLCLGDDRSEIGRAFRGTEGVEDSCVTDFCGEGENACRREDGGHVFERRCGAIMTRDCVVVEDAVFEYEEQERASFSYRKFAFWRYTERERGHCRTHENARYLEKYRGESSAERLWWKVVSPRIFGAYEGGCGAKNRALLGLPLSHFLAFPGTFFAIFFGPLNFEVVSRFLIGHGAFRIRNSDGNSRAKPVCILYCIV